MSSFAYGSGPLNVPWAYHDDVGEVSHDIRRHREGFLFSSVASDGLESNSVSIAPKKAMMHSLMLPGWGQLDNGRKKKAALFVAAELFFIGGYIYENRLARKNGIDKFARNAHRTNRNSYFIYWFLAKIFGMTDAYVDAQFADFNVRDITPEELKDKR
ncbi:DUF5683 domain-containing protein [Candidatus Latescibacterota bacterium]